MRFLSKIRKNDISYKYIVSLCIMTLISIFVIGFSIYTYCNMKKQNYKLAAKETENTAVRIVDLVDERLDNLRQYYINAVTDNKCQWFLTNEMNYSDYRRYKDISNLMENVVLFGDYIRGYTLVNFKNEWVVSSKGIYPLSDVLNSEVLSDLREGEASELIKNNWYYSSEEVLLRSIDRNYRLTVETGGVNLVLNLPLASVNKNGMLLVNINMDSWKRWLLQNIDTSYEKVIVLDAQNQVVYATDSSLAAQCAAIEPDEDFTIPTVQLGGENGSVYMVSAETSDVMGWKYFVCYDMSKGQYGNARFLFIFVSTLLLFAFLSFTVVRYLIYLPVGRLVKSVSDEDNGIAGNELDFLAGKFVDLKNDKEKMGLLMERNHEKIKELFELQLIRGEVRADDEWEEYIEKLGLVYYKYYASAVMVLDLSDEDDIQGNVNEDAICIKLVEDAPADVKEMLWMPLVYNCYTIFCLFGSEDEESLLQKITVFYEKMQTYTAKSCGYQILMGVSATHTNRRHVSAAYRESINALTMHQAESAEGREEQEKNCHFYLSSVSEHEDNYDSGFEKTIQSALTSMDKELCYKIINDFCDYLGKNSFCNMTLYIYRMIDAILLTAINTKISLEELYPDGIAKLYERIVEVNEAGRVRRSLKSLLIDPILESRKKLLEDNSYSIMEEIERRIVESKGNITLNECADAMGVSQTYIWKVLKMERGKTFSEYQEKYKLEEAKRLLLQTNLSVAEIATELNYTNAQNFIRFFSKGTGVTPGKFRKLY